MRNIAARCLRRAVPKIPNITLDIIRIPDTEIIPSSRTVIHTHAARWLTRRGDPDGIRVLTPIGIRHLHPVRPRITDRAAHCRAAVIPEVSVHLGIPTGQGHVVPWADITVIAQVNYEQRVLRNDDRVRRKTTVGILRYQVISPA